MVSGTWGAVRGKWYLHGREEAADVGGDAVEGAGVHDEYTCRLGRVGVLEQAAVDELGLAAKVDVVGLGSDG